MANFPVPSVVKNTFGRHLGPALVGEFVNRSTNYVTGQLYIDRHANNTDKVKRLRLLLFKIHSVIEAAEAAMPIGNLSLYRWLVELQDAAREGDDMILIFKARDQLDDMQKAGHYGFFLSPLWEAFNRSVRAVTDLFWHDYEADRLAGSLDRLEKISSDVGSFLALLELDSRRKKKKGYSNYIPKDVNPSLSYGVLLNDTESTGYVLEDEPTKRSSGGPMLRMLQAGGHHHEYHH